MLAARAQIDEARRAGCIDRHRERAAPGSPCILPDGIQRGTRDQYVDIWAALHRTERLQPAEHGSDTAASVCPASQAPDKYMRDVLTTKPQFGGAQFPEEPLLHLRSIQGTSCPHCPCPAGRRLEAAPQSAGSGRMFHQ